MTALYHDPDWPRAEAWLRRECQGGSLGPLTVLGAPARRGSITPGHCDLAPGAIRAALDRFSTFDVDTGANLEDLDIRDRGDLDIAELTPEESREPVRTAVAEALAHSAAVVLLGGDNSITLPAVEALGPCGLITFDAHLDLRSLDRGLTNGNPIRALLASGFDGKRIVQIGIQAFANSGPYWKIACEAGIHVVSADEARRRGIENVVRGAIETLDGLDIYVDLDLDVLDRAFAPATPGSRPGGLTPWDLRTATRIVGECERVRVMDLVEMDPSQDVAGQTALAAAACFLSFASGVHGRCSRSSTARNF